ncbi:MAG: nucleotidyl transferase AbiEii/AbiGii toxin family protein, partial [candidate division WOR-3 bacterium]|nr:nucleotidyl transferase AbiEii/AbiGii toxin family protein [candidate division WOR-3 bacterium]
LNLIRRKIIVALFSDDYLMDKLVLKGGSAIDLVYKIDQRSSIDLDFSMEDDFKNSEMITAGKKIKSLINRELLRENYQIFDFKFEPKPKNNQNKNWGGYRVEFKIIEKDKFNPDDLNKMRRESRPINKKFHKKFTVDFSKYEYINEKIEKNLDGYIIYVYSVDLIIIEKIRSICQQNPEYRSIIASAVTRERARDFYDIYLLMKDRDIDKFISDNVLTIKNVFKKKDVPLKYLLSIEDQFEIHCEGYSSLKDTVMHKEELLSFREYFEYVKEICRKFYESISLG